MAIRDLVPRLGRKHTELPQRQSDADPFRLFQRDMNRLFDDFFADRGMLMPWGGQEAVETFTPRVDVAETDTEVKVSVELPGMDEKDVTVEMDDNAITIRGEKREEKEEKKGSWSRREQYYGSFHRMVPLPAAVDGQKATAKFKKGVLSITTPKREPGATNRKRIAIESN